MQELEPPSDVKRDSESDAPEHELGALAVEESVLEAAVGHQLVNEEESTGATGGAEAKEGDDAIGGVDKWGEGELVVEFALALERAGIHELNGGRERGWREGGAKDGAEAALAELLGRREGGCGAAEGGVGEGLGLVVEEGRRNGPGAGELAVEKEGEEEEEKDGGEGGSDGQEERG